MSSEVEDWFDLGARDFQPVFSFQVRGHQFVLGRERLGREFTASVLPYKNEMSVLLHIAVLKLQGGAREELGRIEVEVSYRRGGAGRYVFAEAKLEHGGRRLSEAEVEALVDVDEGLEDAALQRLMKAW
jgi:hypothetical protein